MEKFSCDRRVKCRTTSSSPLSGRSGALLRRSAAGMSVASGTGSGHWSAAPRPGRECSTITGSRWAFIVWIPFRAAPSGGADGIERLGERARVMLDVAGGLGFGGAHQQRIAELGVVAAEIEPAEDAALRERREHRCDGPVKQ